MLSSQDNEESGKGEIMSNANDVIAQYQTTRVRAMGWTSYKRYYALMYAISCLIYMITLSLSYPYLIRMLFTALYFLYVESFNC